MKIAITGGFGFIGSNLVNYLVQKYPDYEFTIIDDVSHYAAHPENVMSALNLNQYTNIDINNALVIDEIFNCNNFDGVIHLAAESHVDKSIDDPLRFVKTNVIGTCNLLEASRKHGVKRFYQISTDEVFGHLGAEGKFTEDTPYAPRSPYSASKASADHLVRAYHATYGLPVVLSNCSNNYGPHQDQEKLIPTVIRSILQGNPIPVYGKGDNVRDWLHVEDHCAAIDNIFHEGEIGETYCVGGDNELQNIEIIEIICEMMEKNIEGNPKDLISYVEDRKGHDFRYAVDCEKLKTKLSWKQNVYFIEGLRKTIDWYIEKHEKEVN